MHKNLLLIQFFQSTQLLLFFKVGPLLGEIQGIQKSKIKLFTNHKAVASQPDLTRKRASVIKCGIY